MIRLSSSKELISNVEVECKVCKRLQKWENTFMFKEMMYGSMENFLYVQCKYCNSLNISQIPNDLNELYRKDYYSFSIPNTKDNTRLKFFLIRNRTKSILENKNYFGRFLNFLRTDHDLLLKYLKYAEATLNSRILDVGAGNGMGLFHLYRKGFNKLEGIDPFIERDISFKGYFKVYKKDISEIRNKKYDIILLNHVIEHLPDPHSFLEICRNLLNENGKVIVRTPLLDSYAWKNYRENWVQLDAPRHLTIFTKSSISDLFYKYQFDVIRVFYDSNEFQFWGSELYRKGIPLVEKNRCEFSKKQLSEWKQESSRLNESQEGDQAAFILFKR